jgi:hypothetical protein
MELVKSDRMRWAGHVALMEEVRNEYNIFTWKIPREQTISGGKRASKWVLKNCLWGCGSVSADSGPWSSGVLV